MTERGLIAIAMIALAGCAPNFEAACTKAGLAAGSAAFTQCVAEKEAAMDRWRAEALRYHGRGGGGAV